VHGGENPEEDISIGRAAAVDGVGVGPDKQMHLERSTMQGVIMFPSFTQYTHARSHFMYIYIYIRTIRMCACAFIRIRREVYASTAAKTVSLTLFLSLSRIPFGIYPPLRFVLYFFFISYYSKLKKALNFGIFIYLLISRNNIMFFQPSLV